jgi:hypothetical protein
MRWKVLPNRKSSAPTSPPNAATALTIHGKAVLVVHVPEAQPQDKPIFFKAQGLPKGALRRCFPMMRVDYIRVPGREWVPQPPPPH